MPAVWYRVDNVREEFEQAEAYTLLHQAAAKHGWVFKVERSNITRGWTYNANILKVEPTGRFYEDAPTIERMRHFSFGAGQGRNPILALIDGVRLVRIHHDPLIAVLILECEMWLLARAIRVERQKEEREALLLLTLDQHLDALTAILRSVNVPRITPGEDDDL